MLKLGKYGDHTPISIMQVLVHIHLKPFSRYSSILCSFIHKVMLVNFDWFLYCNIDTTAILVNYTIYYSYYIAVLIITTITLISSIVLEIY
jgi:hypothetical protein